ncbi:MAG: hypothetical protein MI747_03615 [Desulfobacterales bacterium]|nr:hypothetical protein [Desulfobacterales bacterium]
MADAEKMEKLQKIEADIRAIDRDMAAADKRLERFRALVEKSREENERMLERFGVKSMDELECLILKTGILPETRERFQAMFSAAGKELPPILGNDLPEREALAESVSPVKKKKRTRIRL